MRRYNYGVYNRILTVLLALSLLCGLGACTFSVPGGTAGTAQAPIAEETPKTKGVEVWYCGATPAAGAFQRLLNGSKQAVVTIYPNDELLLSALESHRPDVLLTDAAIAQTLADKGLVRELNIDEASNVNYSEAARALLQAGGGVYPICSTVRLLGVNRAAMSGVLSSETYETRNLEYLTEVIELAGLAAASGRNGMLELRSTAFLFDEELFGTGECFSGELTGGEPFKRVYNTLAEGFFCGGAVGGDESSVTRLVNGDIGVLWQAATDFAGTNAGTLEFFALRNIDGEATIRGSMYVMAIMCGEENQAATAELIAALLTEMAQTDSIAAAGLLPACDSVYPENTLGQCLKTLYASWRLSIIGASEPWLEKAEEFNEAFLAKMELLAPEA